MKKNIIKNLTKEHKLLDSIVYTICCILLLIFTILINLEVINIKIKISKNIFLIVMYILSVIFIIFSILGLKKTIMHRKKYLNSFVPKLTKDMINKAFINNDLDITKLNIDKIESDRFVLEYNYCETYNCDVFIDLDGYEFVINLNEDYQVNDPLMASKIEKLLEDKSKEYDYSNTNSIDKIVINLKSYLYEIEQLVNNIN